MSLTERIAGTHPTRAKIPVHAAQAIIGEFGEGTLTQAQAVAAMNAVTNEPLDAVETTDLVSLGTSISSIAVSGSQAAQAQGRANRNFRKQKIDQTFLLAEAGVPGYSNDTEVRGKLGL